MGKLDGAMFRRLLMEDRPWNSGLVREMGPSLASARNGKSHRSAKLGHAAKNTSSRTGTGAVRRPFARSNSACAIVKTSRGHETAAVSPPQGEMLTPKCSDCNAIFSPECSIFGSDSDPGKFLCRTCVSGKNVVGTECSKCQRFVPRVSDVYSCESGRTELLCDDCVKLGPQDCVACRRRTSGPVARLGDKVYHIGCLKCSLCSASISGEASHTPPFGLICATCGEGVTGQSEQLEKVTFDGNDVSMDSISPAVMAALATPLMPPTASATPAGVAETHSEETAALQWDQTSVQPTQSVEATGDESAVWYHFSEGGCLAVRSTRTSQGIPESAPILRSLAPLLPGRLCSMRLKVTCSGSNAGNTATAVDLDIGLAASTALCEAHSSNWQMNSHCVAETATETKGWVLLCSGPSAAQFAAVAEAGGMVETPPSNSVSGKVARLPNRAASWHCELHDGDILTIAVEFHPRWTEAGNVPIGAVNFSLNSTHILQADLPSPSLGPDDAEGGEGVVSSKGGRPVHHVVAAVRQPGVGLKLCCDENVRLCL